MSSTHPSSSHWEPPSPGDLQRMLPQYEITGILGRGGMGAVYKGRQINLDREVAIKVLPETFTKGDDELNFAARFKQEARAMAKLDHPAILSVYDFGETSEGQLYFIMEFSDGMDIHQYLQHHGGKLPQEQALSITAHVLDALDYAHSQGIVHRDIKPANILLNREGRVKIADFGLAKKLEAAGGNSMPALTMTNVAVGTPDFVAPEALDSDQKPDHRADLYAVGVMLYQMLTGKLPRGQFKSPSELDPTIDPRLDEIVSKAMQPHPDDRYSSASVVRADLDVIFTQPFERVEAGEESSVVAAVVPVTTSVKGGQVGKAGRYPPATPERSKLPLFLGVGAAAVALVGLAMMATRGKPESEPSVVSPTTIVETPAASPSVPKVPVAAEVKLSETETIPATTSTAVVAKKTSTPPPSPSFPPGQWVKMFSKVEDLPASIQQQIDPENWDGWIPPQLIDLPQDLKTNYSVRARFRAAATPQEKSYISVRREHADSVASLMTTGAEIVGQVRSASGIEYFLKAKNPNPVPAGGDYQVEFAVVGRRFVARLNPSVFQSVKADCPSEGLSRIDAKSPIRNIEFMNLEGMPEAEALRILGVDEQGRDLRAPQPETAAPGPPTPVTDVDKDAFPPGQWVKMFTRPEDLPDDLRQPDSGVKFENGWMVIDGESRKVVKLSVETLENHGVRAAIRRKESPEGRTGVILRSHLGYRYTLGTGGTGDAMNKEVAVHRIEGDQTLNLGRYQNSEFKRPGEEDEMEFSVVGRRLVCRVGTSFVQIIEDRNPIPRGGIAYISGTEDLRDIEVINLDGLPEAEALRLLGVDEQGKDLRAAAAKEAQQKAEEAKKTDALSAIPELKTLHDQFVALEKTRVTDPFNAEVANLNTGYLGGLDRAIEDEKKAGHLDGVLAIEQEKANIGSGEPVPKEDEATTPEALKKLRGIYREAYAKLEVTRAANRLALTAPLSARLKQIEADLTRQDRIEHARTVREYREALESPAAEASLTVTAGNQAPTVAPTARTERVRPDPEISRAAAEHVIARGGEVVVSSDGTTGLRVKPGSPLPEGRIELQEVYFPFRSDLEITDEDVETLAQARELQRFIVGGGTRVAVTSLTPFRNSTLLYELVLPAYGEVTAEDCEALGSLPSLRRINFQSNKPIADLARLLNAPSLESFSFPVHLQPGDGEILNRFPKLKFLNIGGDGIGSLLLQMGNMDQIEELSLTSTPISAAHLEALNANLKKTLVTLQIGTAGSDSSGAVDVAIRRFPKLEFFSARGKISEDVVLNLSDLKELTVLTLHQAEFTPRSYQALSKCRKLKRLTIGNGRLTADDIAALRRLGDLKTLTLRDNGIQIDTAVIPEFAKLEQLTQLDLPESQTTDQQIEALRRALPKCTISRVPRYE